MLKQVVRRKAGALLLGLSLVIGFGVVSTVLAEDANAASDPCPLGYTCLYENKNFGGYSFRFQWYVPDLRQFGDFGGWNDTWDNKASSVYNHGRESTVYLYEHIKKGGTRKTLAKGTWIAELSSVKFNDMASSAYFAGW